MGIAWQQHRIDPASLESHLLENVNSIRPWIFRRPETRSTINYGYPFKIFITHKKDFLENFTHGKILGTELCDNKLFVYNFPKLPDKATPADMFVWLGSVSYHCAAFGIFVPPPHTMYSNDIYGR